LREREAERKDEGASRFFLFFSFFFSFSLSHLEKNNKTPPPRTKTALHTFFAKIGTIFASPVDVFLLTVSGERERKMRREERESLVFFALATAKKTLSFSSPVPLAPSLTLAFACILFSKQQICLLLIEVAKWFDE
jgi:hypothetical protein